MTLAADGTGLGIVAVGDAVRKDDVSCSAPNTTSQPWATEAEPYRQKMLKILEDRLLPGLTARVTESLVFTPETFRDRYLSPHGAGFSLEPRILQSAWFRPHNVSEELPGLYLAGAGTHPGAGVPGVIGTAEVLATLVPDAPVRAAMPSRMAAE